MRRCLVFCLVLTACDAPTRGFHGAEVSRHIVDGNSFSVYRKDDQAQAVRTNRTLAPRIGSLAGQAAVAMQQATGCRVRDIAGDAAVLVGRLSCSETPWPPCQVEAVLKGRRGFFTRITRTCDRPT